MARRWVCVEHPGPWARDVTESPEPQIKALAARAKESGWRLQLIRRPGWRNAAPCERRVLLADTHPASTRLTSLTVTNLDDLTELALPRDGELPGTEVTDPTLLVCTHGRRDRCCAIDGRALLNELTRVGEVDVWETTHLGGHRFAPTAVVLPTGYVYGRLDGASAVTAVKAARSGEVEPSHCRGRATWSPPLQVAELAVRSATGVTDAAALVPTATDSDEVVVAARDGRRWAVTVSRVERQPRPASCGQTAQPVTAMTTTKLRLL